MLSTAAGCFGFEQWRDMLRENCEANRKREIALAQAREEVSESMTDWFSLRKIFSEILLKKFSMETPDL
ncbi:unnamed protein product [Gongylonema pulchrum]|uniref:Uncharacterized protein n=1 Tax=Gongylonema pulchrum TaxID=637853 RepID=A0A183DMC8_9BILA|nr:unnamed protein product [Gongylonema pulchrum]